MKVIVGKYIKVYQMIGTLSISRKKLRKNAAYVANAASLGSHLSRSDRLSGTWVSLDPHPGATRVMQVRKGGSPAAGLLQNRMR